MIIFHEGLPRSGKSYSAVVDHIIPALTAGRRVLAYIEGLNHAQIAKLAGITLEKCQELLIQVVREDVYLLHSRDYKDTLIAIDEVQNFWPADRKPLNDEVTRFITEHGHHGADILLMGQCLRDVHSMWVNRVARKYYFQQRDAIGKPNDYTVSICRAVPGPRGVKFEETTKETKSYDPKYFGCYQSHVAGTENKTTLEDKRAVVWNSPMFRKWLPLFGVVFLVALGYLIYLFQGGGLAAQVTQKPAGQQSPAPGQQRPQGGHQAASPAVQQTSAPSAPAASSSLPPEKAAEAKDDDDYVKQISAKGKPRLLSVVRNGRTLDGTIQWSDNARGDVIETLTFGELAGLGWSVFVNTSGSMAILRRGPLQYVVTSAGLVKGAALK